MMVMPVVDSCLVFGLGRPNRDSGIAVNYPSASVEDAAMNPVEACTVFVVVMTPAILVIRIGAVAGVIIEDRSGDHRRGGRQDHRRRPVVGWMARSSGFVVVIATIVRLGAMTLAMAMTGCGAIEMGPRR
jgi:hypothetical protein